MNPFRAFRGQGETPLPAKIILMVAGSLALGLALAFADPDNTRLMPSFSEHFQQVTGEVPKKSLDEQEISRVIVDFNRDLARAYLELDAAVLASVPLDDRLRKDYVDEIAFLKKDERVLELTVRDIRVSGMSKLSDDMLSVNTTESVRIRYLNAKDKTEIVSYPEARSAMNYTLDKVASGWKIVQVATLNVGRRDE